MNEHEFEAQLRADGYTEIETQTLEARPGKGRHRHLFAIRDWFFQAHSMSRWIQSLSRTALGRYSRLRKDSCTTSP